MKKLNRTDVVKHKFFDFVSEILNLTLESHEHDTKAREKVSSLSKKEFSVDDFTKEESYILFKTTRSIHVSHFCYIMTLFERYLMTLGKYVIENNKSCRERYNSLYESIGSDSKYAYLNLIKFSLTPKKRLSKLNEIAKTKHGIKNLCKDLLLIKHSERTIKNYEQADNVYIEMRERYNLIKHRSDTYDDIYIKNVQSRLKKKQKVDVEKIFNKFVINRDNTKLKNNNKKSSVLLIDQKVIVDRYYFHESVRSLLFLSTYYTYHAVNDESTKIDILNHTAHESLKASYTLRSLVINSIASIIPMIHGTYKDLADILQFNFCISVKRRLMFLNQYVKERGLEKDAMPAHKKYIEEKNNFLNKIVKDIKFTNEFKDIIKLFCTNKHTEFLNMIFKLKKITQHDLQTWSIFQEYRNNKTFLKLYKNKYKEDYRSL